MKLSFQRSSWANLSADLIVVPVSKSELNSRAADASGLLRFSGLDAIFEGDLSKLLKKEEFEAKPMETSLVKVPGGSRPDRFLFLGWKSDEKKSVLELGEQYRKLGHMVASRINTLKAKSVAITGELGLEAKEHLLAFLEGYHLASYQFENYKMKKSPKPLALSATVQVVTSKAVPKDVVKHAKAIYEGMALARDVIRIPGKDCNPSYMLKRARQVAKEERLRIQVFDENRLRQMKAEVFLSVSGGSKQKPYLVKMVYRPSGKPKKIVSIVGKGITFDSGGYSIKMRDGMMGMKADMAGAAAVLGFMKTVRSLSPKVEVRGYMALSENMINGEATKPGDVFRAMNGKSVEVLNTDAEGRLVLADTLTFAEREKPDMIIDLATLTGACVAALGNRYAGLFSNSDGLAKKILDAGHEAGERYWHLPLAVEYKDQLKSEIADLKNIGSGSPGAITAALFLAEFVEKVDWAHLDIAGAGMASDGGYLGKGAPGFGVRTLARLVSSM